MAFLNCHIHSSELSMATTVQVILPDTGDLSEAKTVYLLHGLSDDSTSWSRYTACEQYARTRGLAVVMPEVQRSFYNDMAQGLPYFTYVSRELPSICRRMFGLSADRERNYIMGLSMGGFGALKCALTYPERYAGCGSFSGVVDVQTRLLKEKFCNRENIAIWGSESQAGPENDLRGLVKRDAGRGPLPRLYLSCGEQDVLYDMNCAFHRFLTEQGVASRFDHREGGHTWEFWDRSLRDCFAYFFDDSE